MEKIKARPRSGAPAICPAACLPPPATSSLHSGSSSSVPFQTSVLTSPSPRGPPQASPVPPTMAPALAVSLSTGLMTSPSDGVSSLLVILLHSRRGHHCAFPRDRPAPHYLTRGHPLHQSMAPIPSQQGHHSSIRAFGCIGLPCAVSTPHTSMWPSSTRAVACGSYPTTTQRPSVAPHCILTQTQWGPSSPAYLTSSVVASSHWTSSPLPVVLEAGLDSHFCVTEIRHMKA